MTNSCFRHVITGVLIGAFCLVAGVTRNGQGEETKSGSALPLKKVVLFNSGVGFFEHRAQVDGDVKIDLKFNVDSINDLLKSMVLQDLGNGRISTVTYGSQDPITKTLKTFAIDLTSNPTLAQLLDQVRGEKVSIDAPNQVTGTILGVERRKQRVGEKELIEIDVLNLLTEEGLRSVSLENVGRIKLDSQQLDAELRQALMVLARGHATDKKTVSLSFQGQGKRPVQVGYIQESPIWKTSYRLVLSDEKAPLLQGWAIVENTTEEDWKDVDLTLVSGRPISFIMDLYQPLYVPRPVVEPELFASLRPQTYGQDMDRKEAEFRGRNAAPMAAAPPAPPGAGFGGMANGRGEGLARRAAGDKADAFAYAQNGLLAEKAKAAFDPSAGVQSAAQAGDVGEMFQYAIATPVSLPRQQSAMLAIVNGSVQGEKVSIYNARVHAKHPLNGLKLTNSTGLHLMQGPITVFDDGAYAGDARIEDLQPGTVRLISYAMDLDTEVAPETLSANDQMTSVKLVNGVLQVTRKYSRKQQYTVKNSGSKVKKVLIEYPFDPTWTLIAPSKPDEKTRDMYRFDVAAEPGKPTKLVVDEERPGTQQVVLSNADDGTILIYLNSKVVSDGVKKALSDVMGRKQALQRLMNQRKQLEQDVQVIDQEQARIRQNMAAIDRNTDLYKRYVSKLDLQETSVESLRNQIKALTSEETKQRDDLNKLLSTMTAI